MNRLLALAAAALVSGLISAQAQDIRQLTASGNAFCSQVKGGNAMDCGYATMVDCVRVARPNGDSCIPNPNPPPAAAAARKKK